ncbi:MAG TPA: methyltransferase domain-containing protein [Bryobacteraceae bacterium]|jgi:SAM-dependent methyltransferase|nr:methyltransferase domain-containing protein [Bryobacteraceae bacterium]
MIFKARRIEPEVLDHAPPEVARPNLADLVRINQRFGGHSVLRKMLARVVSPNDAFSLLDVGAASGDSALLIKELYPRARVTSLDLNWTNLETAPQPKILADAFELPFAPASFDYALCSLFLHHFSDDEVRELLRAFAYVAKRAVIVCDLERHILPYLFLPATKRVFGWNEITVGDGMKSVRAAFRAQELVALGLAAGLKNSEAHVFRPAFRIGMISWRE